jgi:hypothetical protein
VSNAAIIEGKLQHFSVSQIRTFQRCRRLWAADKILGLPRDKSPSATKGTQAHKQIEGYYKKGVLPDVKSFTRALSELEVPAYRPAGEFLIEAPLHLTARLDVDGIELQGFADLIIPPSPDGESPPEVYDWKNVGSFDYCVDPAEDLQMLTYALVVMTRYKEWNEIPVTLAYLSTRSSQHRIVRKVVSRERCEREWNNVVTPTVRQMAALAVVGADDFWQVPGNFSEQFAACKAYAGCQFQLRCIPVADRLDFFEPPEQQQEAA